MKIIMLVFMQIIMLLISACASVQTYEGKELSPEKIAHIKSSQYDHILDSTKIQEVDGKALGLGVVQVTVLPGEHRIKFRVVSTAGLVSYSAYVTLSMHAEAGHTYKLDGKIYGGEHLYAWITDETTNKIVAGEKYGADASSYAYSSYKNITDDNNVINMPHYSIEAPPNQGWKLYVEDKTHSIIYLKKSVGTASYQMRFGINWTANESMKLWTAKQVADDYRNGELSDMQQKGVIAGVYDLENVVIGEETIGDKKFYTMDYVISQDGMKQISSLYLYFPEETNIDVFIVINYTEGSIDDELLHSSNKPEFISVLGSLQVKPVTPPKYP